MIETARPSRPLGKTARNLGLAVALPALLFLLAQAVGWILGAGTLGLTLHGQSLIVERGSPAARAGVRTGDQYVAWTPTLADKLDEYNPAAAIGKRYTIHVKRGGHDLTFQAVAVRDKAQRWPTWEAIITFVFGLSFLGIATFLFARLATRVTLAILLLAVSVSDFDAYSAFFASYFIPYIVLIYAWWTVVSAILPWAAATVAVRFPNEQPPRWGRLFERSMILLGALLALDQVYWFLRNFHIFNLPDDYGAILTMLPLVASAAVFLWRGARSRPEARKRFQWVVAGFAVCVTAWTAEAVSVRWMPRVYMDLISLGKFALPASIAYAVLHQRVLDTRVVLGRAFVYGGVTFALVLLFIGIDILSEKWLAGTGLATEVQFAAAIATGFTMRLLHRRIEDTANWLFFRDRLAARERLDAAAASLQHADSAAAIDEFVVDEPVTALQLASGALFVRAESIFTRTHGVGWGDADVREISTNDPFLARLHARWDAIDLSDLAWRRDGLPTGSAAPLLLQPVKSRGQIIALVFYGGRIAGDALDGSDMRALRTLAAAAAAAFDHVEATELRREVGQLRLEIARLLEPAPRARKRARPAVQELREQI